MQNSIYAKQALSLPVSDIIAAELGADIELGIANRNMQSASEFQNASKLLGKFSVFAKSGIVGLDVASKAIEVVQAPVGERGKTAFIKSAEFVGEAIGGYAGGYIVGVAAVPSLGTSLIVAPAVIVGTSAAVGHIFKVGAEEAVTMYEHYKP